MMIDPTILIGWMYLNEINEDDEARRDETIEEDLQCEYEGE